MQRRWSDDLVTITMGSAAAAYADDMQPAAFCLPCPGAAQMSYSNYQQGLTLELVCEQRQPFASRLRVDQGGNTIVQHQQAHKDVFGSFLLVNTAVIGDLHTFRNPVEGTQIFDPGTYKMDGAKPRRHYSQILARDLHARDKHGCRSQAFRRIHQVPTRCDAYVASKVWPPCQRGFT